MLSIAVVLTVSTSVFAAPRPQQQALSPFHSISTVAPEVRVYNPDGSYVYGYENSDGTKVSEEGKLKDLPPSEDNPAGPAIVATGSFLFTFPDGSVQKVEYSADELGFRPVIQHSNRK